MAQWDKLKTRGNVDDRRGLSGGLLGGLGGFGLIIVILANLLGGSESAQLVSGVLEQLNTAQTTTQSDIQPEEFRGDDEYEVFVSKVLGSNNDTWTNLLSQSGVLYNEPRLVLFRGSTNSGCGGATSQIGPHYCPADKTIYIDETFFDELERRFGGSSGSVAQSYVIAHEVAHHVQHELNLDNQVNRSNNQDSINFELQADCFAGVWASSIKSAGIFGPGEIQEAISAAEAVGDDRIQEKTTGRVNPEDWTHGSSAQRVEWFTRGYNTGRPADCNTFTS